MVSSGSGQWQFNQKTVTVKSLGNLNHVHCTSVK